MTLADTNRSSHPPTAARDTPCCNLIFDLDGTLVDSVPGIAASLGVAFHAVSRTLHPSAAQSVRQAIGPPIRVIARRVQSDLTDAELDTIEPVYRTDYDTQGWRRTTLFPGVQQILAELNAAGLRLFILTNKPQLPTASILNHFNLAPLFSGTLTRDGRTPHFTSKAEMLSTLLERHQLDPAATRMIGDTAEDQEAAHVNRLDFVHVTYGYGTIASPVVSIDHFSHLPSLLRLQDPS